MADGVVVQGLAELMKGLAAFDAEAAAGMRESLKKGGELVRADAADRFEGYSPKSAAGYRVYLRAGSRVDVEQSLGRTTGKHPEFGALQMRQALLPALADKQEQIFADVEAMLTVLADRI